MTNFNDRERGEEAKYAFDEENQIAAFGIAGQMTRKLFMSHPPLAERIAALQAQR